MEVAAKLWLETQQTWRHFEIKSNIRNWLSSIGKFAAKTAIEMATTLKRKELFLVLFPFSYLLIRSYSYISTFIALRRHSNVEANEEEKKAVLSFKQAMKGFNVANRVA